MACVAPGLVCLFAIFGTYGPEPQDVAKAQFSTAAAELGITDAKRNGLPTEFVRAFTAMERDFCNDTNAQHC